MLFRNLRVTVPQAVLLTGCATLLPFSNVQGQAAPMPPPPAAPQEQTLGSVTVTDTAIDDAESETGYKVSRNTGAMRTDMPLIDVPQSVSIVTARQIQDQAATSIEEAIRYTPGVFSAQGEGNRETLVFRGNQSTGDFFVDGIRDDVQTYRDLYNIDRLEIYKGSNAMIFGRGGIGGLVNRVTKVADGQYHRAFGVQGGSYQLKRAQFDLGAPVLGDTVSARLTGVYEDANSYRDRVGYDRWGFNPTVAVALGPNTTVTLGYEHFQDSRVADRGVSSYLGRALAVPRGRFFGDPANSPTGTNTDAQTLFIEHRFSDTVVLRNRTRNADYDKYYRNIFPGAVNTATVVNPAGLPAGSYAPGTIVQIQAYSNAQDRNNLINQTDLNAEFDTGGIHHTLLLGGEYSRQRTRNVRLEGFFPTAANPLGVQAIFATIADPTIARPDTLFRPIASSGANRGTLTVAAGYLQDQIDLSSAFQLVAGVRYEHVRSRVTDLRTVGFPTGQQRDFDVTDHLWSPRLGLIVKPAQNASLYAAYSRTYLPRSGDQFTSLSITNQALDPEKYDNYEVGAKWDVVPTLDLTAAVFQLDRSNVLALSDPNNSASATVPIGRQRTRGVELSATGQVTDRLSVVGGYTYSDGKFLDTVSGTVRAGNRLANLPRHAASLWTRFDPVEAFGVAAGVQYQGRRYAATDNAVSTPSYLRVDGALFYHLSEAVALQLNVENIFDKRYFLFANSNTNITPGSPRAFRAALNARF